jgi:hypothetical protein
MSAMVREIIAGTQGTKLVRIWARRTATVQIAELESPENEQDQGAAALDRVAWILQNVPDFIDSVDSFRRAEDG